MKLFEVMIGRSSGSTMEYYMILLKIKANGKLPCECEMKPFWRMNKMLYSLSTLIINQACSRPK